MRLLIEHGNHRFSNLGDLALLQVAVDRVRMRFPKARIAVPTLDPERTLQLVPAVEPLDLSPALDLAGPVRAALRPLPIGLRIRLEDLLARRSASRAKPLPPDLLAWAENADAVLHAGAGVLADPFTTAAIGRLQLLRFAQRSGAATAAFSQGLGPVTDPDLRSLAEQVLPHLDLLALRNRRTGPEIARRLGVTERRMHFTGDDALAIAEPRAALGQRLGVNLRLAEYAGITTRQDDLLDRIASALARAQRALPCELTPLLVDRLDRDAVNVLLGEAALDTGDPHEFTLSGLKRALSRCRVVVSGSYHASALALAMGIATVGLYRSEYYRLKFEGLQDSFGPACRPIHVDRPDLAETLKEQIVVAWRTAETQRAASLDRARGLVDRSQRAYWRFFDLLTGQR